MDLEQTVSNWPDPYGRLEGSNFRFIELENFWIIGDQAAKVDRLWHVINITGEMASVIGLVKEDLCAQYDYVKRIPKRDVDTNPDDLCPRKIRTIPRDFKHRV